MTIGQPIVYNRRSEARYGTSYRQKSPADHVGLSVEARAVVANALVTLETTMARANAKTARRKPDRITPPTDIDIQIYHLCSETPTTATQSTSKHIERLRVLLSEISLTPMTKQIRSVNRVGSVHRRRFAPFPPSPSG